MYDTCLPAHIPMPTGTTQKLAGIDWYDGSEGYIDGACPCLAIGYQNGRVQIMRNERDDSPVLIDACMKISAMRWSPNGTVLAIAGSQVRCGTVGRSMFRVLLV